MHFSHLQKKVPLAFLTWSQFDTCTFPCPTSSSFITSLSLLFFHSHVIYLALPLKNVCVWKWDWDKDYPPHSQDKISFILLLQLNLSKYTPPNSLNENNNWVLSDISWDENLLVGSLNQLEKLLHCGVWWCLPLE